MRAGWVLTCVGSLSRVALRLAGSTSREELAGVFEIVSLVGTLAPQGARLHLAVSDHQGRTAGGHLLDGCTVRTTAEVVIAADERLAFSRKPDPDTGYDELVVGESR